jgi:alpha-beta hydrolase superfamily lysophospholipase
MRAMRKVVVGLVGTAGALVVLVVGGGGWVYSGQLLPAPSRDRTLDLTATLTDRGTVLLPPDRRACLQRFGLLLPDEAFVVYGGEVLGGSCADPATRVEREVEAVVVGDPPTGAELPARFDEYAGFTEPADVDVDVTEVAVPLGDDLGDAPAWRVEGSADWIIVVHGRSGTRAEALRVLPTLAEDGRSVLVITHRNDMAGGPATADAVGRFGQEEWRDLAAAVGYAQEQGAERIVLMGFSQGGSLISYYLREAGEDAVDAVILDSPLLSLGATLRQQARLRDIPDPLIPPILLGTRIMAQLRAGFAIADVEHVRPLADTSLPMLLIHGIDDDFVPPDPSDELAARRPQDLVYERIPGAGHTEGWNTDRARYTAAVSAFLDDVLD